MAEPEQIEHLVRDLAHGNARTRRAAARALGELGDPRAVDLLVGAVASLDLLLREAAVQALGRLRHPRAVEPLVGALGTWNVCVRLAAVQALGELGDARAVEPLLCVLERGDRLSRRAAAEALGQLGAAAGAALEPLRRMHRLEKDDGLRTGLRDAVRRIEAALRTGPAELEAAAAPAGSGTELEAADIAAAEPRGSDAASRRRPRTGG